MYAFRSASNRYTEKNRRVQFFQYKSELYRQPHSALRVLWLYKDGEKRIDRYKNDHGYPKTFDSWEILNDKIALKTVDKSVLIHHGTGIPIQTRYFFEIDKMVSGERKNINLSYQNKDYEFLLYYHKNNQK